MEGLMESQESSIRHLAESQYFEKVQLRNTMSSMPKEITVEA